MDRPGEPEVRQAVHELNRYLSDQVAPLMVADALSTLMRTPPEVTSAAIGAWAGAQRRLGQEASVADFLFHALKKIQLMSHLSLVPREALTTWLESLVGLTIHECPEAERAGFAEAAKGLGRMDIDPADQIQVLHLQGAAGGAPKAASAGPGRAAPISDDVARGLRRFSLLVDRLEKLPSDPQRREEALTQALGMAAVQARSDADLEQYLQRLKAIGVEPHTEQVFRALARNLPGWILPESAGASVAVPASRPAEAMHRLVANAGSMEETRARFAEMVHAAIEQFNEGQLQRAASMFEVLDRVLADHRIDPDSAKVILMRAQDRLSNEMLDILAEQPAKHGRLRKVLAFFPAYSVQGLLGQLQGEEKRERREWLMTLLEAHGDEARRIAFQQATALVAAGDPDVNGWYLRNLVSLLRRIPMPAEDSPDQEIALLTKLARWGQPMLVIKESLGALSAHRSPRAEKSLIELMRDYEKALLEGDLHEEDIEDLHQMLDRCASSLASRGTSNALRTVANHAFRTEPALGNTMARLSRFGGRNLSHDQDLLGRLVESLRADLPRKVLGFTMNKKSGRPLALVQALAGTPSDDVQALLKDIAERYPGEEFGQAAERAVASFAEASAPGGAARQVTAARTGVRKPAAAAGTAGPDEAPADAPPVVPGPSLSGDLELFALPTLVQTVADSRMSGVLTMSGRDGLVESTIVFEEGKIRTCTVDALSGENAFFQLFERPPAGTFSFRNQPAAKGPDASAGELIEVLPAMLEGMRRYDELLQARGVVPDDASFKPTQVKPTAPPDETDKALLLAVWGEASRGATPAACEKSVAVDAYRIRRLYVHWLEQGALQLPS